MRCPRIVRGKVVLGRVAQWRYSTGLVNSDSDSEETPNEGPMKECLMGTKRTMYQLPFCFGLLAIVSLVGCGAAADPLGRQDISGEVKLKNEPLDGGSILFEPEDTSNPTSGGAAIENGKFELPKGRGLAPGEYKVRISAAGGATERIATEAPGEPVVSTERVPKNWNSQSEQTVTIENKGKNHLVFEIP